MATTKTENGAASLATTGDARVNLFFKTVRGLDVSTQNNMLDAAWAESDIDTLRLIFQTRDCRGGKGEKQLFANSLKWLAANHPEVLKKNLELIPEFGTWKDLLSLAGTPFEADVVSLFALQLKKDLERLKEWPQIQALSLEGKKKKEIEPKELTPEQEESRKIEQKQREEERRRTEVSLCAKWAPTEGHGNVEIKKMANKIAKELCGKTGNRFKVYRKEYLTPLRQHLKITERYMCDKKWNEINYSRVASRCMNLQRKAFVKHDAERFSSFLADVKSGKSSIKGKQMFPHELAAHYIRGHPLDEVVELQWNVLLEEAKKLGALSSSIVLSDVSGSMSGTPMEVSIALGLLISQLTAEPFKNLIITFHETPTFHQVQGHTFHEQVKDVQAMPWGGTTNFQAAFDLILNQATSANLPQEAMPKRLFVISDMQFNEADGGASYATNHEVVERKFKDAGYTMPQMIYWNVRANTPDFPVSSDKSGVGLISGFSPSLLKVVMSDEELNPSIEVAEVKKPQINPYDMMRKAIDDERYQALTL